MRSAYVMNPIGHTIFPQYSFCGLDYPLSTTENSQYKMLSYRRETALQGALQFSPRVEDWNWKTIFYGRYRSIYNRCNTSSLKICRIP